MEGCKGEGREAGQEAAETQVTGDGSSLRGGSMTGVEFRQFSSCKANSS